MKTAFLLIAAIFLSQHALGAQPPGGRYLCWVSKYQNTIFSPLIDTTKPIDFSLPANQNGVALADTDKYVVFVNETASTIEPYASQFVIYTEAKAQPHATISLMKGYVGSYQQIDFVDGVSKASVTCEKQ